jgi:hypothetical protein
LEADRLVEDEQERRVDLDGMLQVVDLELGLAIALKRLVLLDDMALRDCLLMRDCGSDTGTY